ncbi:MAG: ribosome-binding factor A [Elusimicrobia bacterium RIFOXYA2_FULL_39_19]|nr:MAG: ribosome-binding factor A [Elusimicrobia bacterium RIFOXYA2_FULL_39_19]
MRQFKRSERVAKLLQKEVCKVILEELRDPRLGFVTITGLELTDDMSIAKVYFSVLGDEKQVKTTHTILNGAKSYIKKFVGDAVYLRKVPEILFFYDDTAVKATNVFNILEKIKNETEATALTADNDKDKDNK